MQSLLAGIVFWPTSPHRQAASIAGRAPTTIWRRLWAACTSMTLRVYAEHKRLALGRLTVSVRHGKLPAEHCQDCGEAAEGRTGKIDRFERVISVEGGVDAAMADKLIEIAGQVSGASHIGGPFSRCDEGFRQRAAA